jgi:thiamine kinase-like enzyme
VIDPAVCEIERLYGLTNMVYRVATPEGTYCLRVPGVGTEGFIDRKVEQVNARAAAAAGVSPEVLHFGDDAIMVTPFLRGTTTMSPELLQTLPGAPSRAGRAFRKLHTSGQAFAFRFELFSMIDDYLAHLDKLGVSQFPDGYHDAVREAAAVRQALAAHPVPLTACHCDPMCENMLDDGERMWIIDWEYSGMNDPLWDLGDFSVEAAYGAEHDRELMAAYFGRAPTDFEHGRMVLYKAMCDLLWTLWGLIQHANGNTADDFWAYATNRFERCRKLMGDPDFKRHLAAVRAG